MTRDMCEKLNVLCQRIKNLYKRMQDLQNNLGA